MKIKYKLKFILASLLLLVGTSCEKQFLDEVAENPNNPVDAAESVRLSGILSNFSYQVIGNEPPRITSYWIQYLAFTGVAPSEDNYDVDESAVNNLWTFSSYTDVMHNAKLLDEKATANGNFHYAGLAKIMLAWNMSIVTDLWGEAPFSEAWQIDKTTKPKYDTQESIYRAIQELLDNAIADLNKESVLSPSADDLVYPQSSRAGWRANSLPKWIRLAYTLKARFHMRLTNAPGYDPVTQSNLALAALANGFESNADNATFAYDDRLGSENPWYQYTIDTKWMDDARLSESYVKRLKSLNDPRLPIQAQPDTKGMYRGAPNGVGSLLNDTISNIGNFYSDADAPLQWLTYAEAKFLEAEATFRVQGAATADTIYKQAVQASMNELGVDPAEAQAYVTALPDLNAANALEQIMEQKYIALFLQFEPYNDWRRTGYPNDLELAEDAVTPTIPVRFPYPEQELLNNAENVNQTGIPVGYDALVIPVWWDK
jgi:hypothetical protein